MHEEQNYSEHFWGICSYTSLGKTSIIYFIGTHIPPNQFGKARVWEYGAVHRSRIKSQLLIDSTMYTYAILYLYSNHIVYYPYTDLI